MSATIACLFVLTCCMLLNIQCSVIRVQEIPLKPGVTMKITVKDDPKNKGGVVASIKIGMDEKPKTEKKILSSLIKDFVMPASDFVPKFDDRSSIGNGNNGNCGRGQVRRGPVCV